MRGRGVRLAPLGAHLASTGLRSVLVWEPEKGKRQTYFLKKRKKSNRQTGGPSCLFQVLRRRGLTPGRPTHWKGQPHPHAPRRPRGGARPHHALLREKREAGPGPRRCAGRRDGRETAGLAAGRAGGAAQSSASLGGGQGCELVPGGHAHQPNLGSWGSQGTCMERMCWRGPGTAFLSVGDLRGRAASGSTPSIGPQPGSPVPGLQRPVRVFSPLGREGGWWPRRRSVPPLPDTLQVEGQPRFQKRSSCRTDHPPGAGWGAADAGLYVKPSPVFPFQGPLDPDQLNYGYENRSVSPRIFNPSLSCGRALATRDHIPKESCGGPVYVCHFQNQAEETEAN